MKHMDSLSLGLVRPGQFGLDVVRGLWMAARASFWALTLCAVLAALALAASTGLRDRAVRMLPSSALTWAQDQIQSLASGDEVLEGADPLVSEASMPVQTSGFAGQAQQKHVTQYLARRYRVAHEAMQALVAVAYESGRQAGVDPLLILAVMAVESSMNPFAESTVGAQGLMQVMTRVHAEKFELHGGDLAALDPVANIKVGTQILRDVIDRGGSVRRGLHLYVGAGNHVSDGGYGDRVLAEHGRLKLAASGKVRMALLYGWRGISPSAQAQSESLPEQTQPSTTNGANASS